MESSWIDTLGDWNPQFLRECRGRLKPRSVLATVTLSLLAQLLLFLSYWQGAQWLRRDEIDWVGLCNNMTWFMSYGLIIVGCYFLINDITQEDRLGTLNFIRLSPRPSQEILLGKVLGVPVLAYLGVALAIPLHFIAGILGQIPLATLVSIYVMLLAGAIFFFSIALLFGLLNGARRFVGQQSAAALAFIVLLVSLGLPIYMGWNFQSVWQDIPGSQNPRIQSMIEWAYLPIQSNFWLAHAFTLLTLAIGTIFIWQMLLRRFLMPRATIVSKPMSYALVAYLEIWMLGFTLNESLSARDVASSGAAFLYPFNLGLFLILMFVLCPGRQEILDWLRFRYSHREDGVEGAPEVFSLRGVWRDLVWADGSPGVIAIAINLLIANALILPWTFLIGPGKEYPETIPLQIAVFTVAILIEAIAVQWIFTAQIRNPGTWAAGILAIWLIVPVTVLNILRFMPQNVPASMTILTLLGYPFTDLSRPLTGFIVAGFILQCLLLIGLVVLLRQKLQQLTLSLQH
jgi:hypothetical protein